MPMIDRHSSGYVSQYSCTFAVQMRVFAILCLFALGLVPGSETRCALAAADVLTMPSEDSGAVAWNLEADSLNTLGDNTIVEARGSVVLKRGDDILKADFARYYATTNWVYLQGNVFVRMGRDDINSDEAEFDLRSKTGWLTNGHVFMEGPHIYFSGSRIIKHWGDRYTFNKAKVTTCDGDKPAWVMNAEQAVVEIDGYAQLFHSMSKIPACSTVPLWCSPQRPPGNPVCCLLTTASVTSAASTTPSPTTGRLTKAAT
ncbi:MAG: hypothetical protein RR014_03380 [Bilophila sp.]